MVSPASNFSQRRVREVRVVHTSGWSACGGRKHLVTEGTGTEAKSSAMQAQDQPPPPTNSAAI